MYETNSEVTNSKDGQDCRDDIKAEELQVIQAFSVDLLDCILLVSLLERLC